jgi:peptidoglycan L-alanyl-D-glutamate endopeptidase CwlK
MKLSPRDEAHLKRVHPDLARVIRRAAAIWPHKGQVFFITCSLRTMEEQRKLLAAGATRTLRSRHLPGKTNKLSHAIDLALKLDGKVRWDWPLFAQMAKTVKAAAKTEKVSIEWGGDWKTFRDGPHFQLPWAKYPG